MGMSFGGGKARKNGRRRSVAEINVTPLVDVMLVLLVIFMITAPTMKEGFSVELPQAETTTSVPIADARLITITADGAVLKPNADTADQRYDDLGQLVGDLKAYADESAAAKKNPSVVVVGDKDTHYERVIQVWNAARKSGITQVSFQLEPGGSAGAMTPVQ